MVGTFFVTSWCRFPLCLRKIVRIVSKLGTGREPIVRVIGIYHSSFGLIITEKLIGVRLCVCWKKQATKFLFEKANFYTRMAWDDKTI